MTDSNTAPPQADPQRCSDSRGLEGTWTIGAPDHDGWQRVAILDANHVKGHGYRVALCNRRTRSGPGYTETAFQFGDPRTQLLDIPAPRLSRKQLTEAFERGLREVRSRYEADDPQICRHFA